MEHTSHTAELVGTIIGLLLIASIVQWLCKRFKLPFTVTLVLVGIGMASLSEYGPELLKPMVEQLVRDMPAQWRLESLGL